MRKKYNKHSFLPLCAGADKRIVPYHERVKRFYPAATCHDDTLGLFSVMANNGTGNCLAASTSSDDAWRRAWTAIEAQRPCH